MTTARDPEEFWRKVSAHFFTEGSVELDYEVFIEFALETGLVQEVLYDPAVHGEQIEGDPEPGEPIYVTVPGP